jgi:hypothetical protein
MEQITVALIGVVGAVIVTLLEKATWRLYRKSKEGWQVCSWNGSSSFKEPRKV